MLKKKLGRIVVISPPKPSPTEAAKHKILGDYLKKLLSTGYEDCIMHPDLARELGIPPENLVELEREP